MLEHLNYLKESKNEHNVSKIEVELSTLENLINWADITSIQTKPSLASQHYWSSLPAMLILSKSIRNPMQHEDGYKTYWIFERNIKYLLGHFIYPNCGNQGISKFLT